MLDDRPARTIIEISIMKTTKTLQLFILIIFFISACKKDRDVSISYSNGIVIDTYTKAPIPGLQVQLKEFTPGVIFGSAGKLLDQTTTNVNGEFRLQLKTTNPDYTHVVYILSPTPFDSTNIANKYMTGGCEYLFASNLSIELKPSGYINLYISQTTWTSLPTDTVIVCSPYATDTLIRGKDGYGIYFYVDASRINQFSYHYIKNGINGNSIIKQIYVPNYYKGNGNASTLFYSLTF